MFLGIISFFQELLRGKSEVESVACEADVGCGDSRQALIVVVRQVSLPEVGQAFCPLDERVRVSEGVDVLGLQPVEFVILVVEAAAAALNANPRAQSRTMLRKNTKEAMTRKDANLGRRGDGRHGGSE